MRTIQTEIEVLASAARTWDVLTATAEWPQWNPFVVELSGRLEVGSPLSVRLKLPGRNAMAMRPVVTKVEPGREFRWRGKLGIAGIFDGEHGFRVTPDGEGRCRFEQFENFSGLLVLPILAMIGTDTRAGFESMNKALKARAEIRAD